MTSKNQSKTSLKYSPKKHLLQILSYICIAVLFVNISCSRQITEPVDDPTPGRRDYVWTVDTVKIPFNLLQRIWGSSPTDVWAVGPGGGLDQTIWHYDGTKWRTDGISRNIAPWSIFGFASNDVWICGEDGKIWHYDGSTWQQSGQYKTNNISRIEDIWGTSSCDLYVMGFTFADVKLISIIMHYDGQTWKICNIPDFNYEMNRAKGIRVGSKKTIAILGFTDNSLTGLFLFDGTNSIRKIYEAADKVATWALCQNIDNELFYTIGNTINTYHFIASCRLPTLNSAAKYSAEAGKTSFCGCLTALPIITEQTFSTYINSLAIFRYMMPPFSIMKYFFSQAI